MGDTNQETTGRTSCPGYDQGLQRNWNGNVTFGGTPIIPESIQELCSTVAQAAGPIRVVGRGHSFAPLVECEGGTLLSLHRLNQIIDFKPPPPSPCPEDGMHCVEPTSRNSSMSNKKNPQRRIGSITLQGGTTYTEVIRYLGTRGSLCNLPSCPQFTVAGAIATGTHGSGVEIPNLASQVSMLEFVKADGTLVRYTRGQEDDDEDNSDDNVAGIFEGCRIHLGCLGVISTLTLDVIPYYEVEAVRYDHVPLQKMIEHLPHLWTTCDSLSVWTAGFGRGQGTGQCWMTFRHFLPPSDKQIAHVKIPSKEVLGDSGIRNDRSMMRYCSDPHQESSEEFTPTIRGPWHDVLTLTLHEGQETSMSVVDLQAEFFVPLEYAQQALQVVWEVANEWTFSSPHGYDGPGDLQKGLVDAMEFRQVKGGDGGWLSPHPVDSLGIHISFNGDPKYRTKIQQDCLPSLEAALRQSLERRSDEKNKTEKSPMVVRAHWGKLSATLFEPNYIQEIYGNGLVRFRKLCLLHDPTGKFRNAHVQHALFDRKCHDHQVA